MKKYFICFLFSLLSFVTTLASSKDGHASEAKFDPGALINHHVMDAHSWEIFHGFVIHLPILVYSLEKGFEVFSSANFYNESGALVPYNDYIMNHEHITLKDGEKVIDVSITKNVLFLFLNAFLMLFIFSLVARGYKKNKGKAPKGIQLFFEPIIVFVRDEIVKLNIGKKYEIYLPYFLTLFFFIWFGNLLGLLPGAANMSGNISITLILSIFTLLMTLLSGNKNYWSHIFNPLGNSMGLLGKIPLYMILIPIELIGILTKPFSLMIRLFANITAGHIIILSIIGLTFITRSIGVGIAASIFASVMNLLELFVAILQAYVFTMLSSMYIGQALEEKHH